MIHWISYSYWKLIRSLCVFFTIPTLKCKKNPPKKQRNRERNALYLCSNPIPGNLISLYRLIISFHTFWRTYNSRWHDQIQISQRDEPLMIEMAQFLLIYDQQSCWNWHCCLSCQSYYFSEMASWGTAQVAMEEACKRHWESFARQRIQNNSKIDPQMR